MNCEEFKARLDAYVDGELSEAEVDEMLEHGKNCAACARELEAAELLRDTLAHIDDDVAVPLEAQAAWRKAVRREAGMKSAKKRMRVFYAAAAAVVVLLGCTAAFRGGRFADRAKVAEIPLAETTQAESAVVVSDGIGSKTAMGSAVTARRKIETADAAAARETLTALCAEYDAAVVSEETQDDGTMLIRIELPRDYMEDFFAAAAQLGTTLDSETFEDASETAVLEFQIQEE